MGHQQKENRHHGIFCRRTFWQQRQATHLKAENNRPDFAILGYPVITMQEGLTHGGSRQNLLGQNPEEDLVNLYSCELQVSIKTPPAFLFHAEDDKVVPIQNRPDVRRSIKI